MNLTFQKLLLIINLLINICDAQEFVSINGNQIQYEKKGTGSPVVIFVAGYGGSLSSFDSVFDKVSKLTTVVRYSRAGLGKSSYERQNKDLDTIVAELASLINTLHLEEPFILAGHSYGGLMIRAYSKRHPERIAGLLFDDATFEDYLVKLSAIEKKAESIELAGHQKVFKKYPIKALDDEFKSLWKVWKSPENWNRWFEPMVSVPTVVLTSMQISEAPLRTSERLMNARYLAHSRWTHGKPFSMQVGIKNAGHPIHKDVPSIFVESIKMLLHVIRDRN